MMERMMINKNNQNRVEIEILPIFQKKCKGSAQWVLMAQT